MMTTTETMLWEPAQLLPQLDNDTLLLVDLSKPANYAFKHLPNAVSLEYQKIIAAQPPVTGLLPPLETLSEVLSSIGWTPEKHVIAYDEEGGAKACRFIWTLHALGYFNAALLNGGSIAWLKEGLPTSSTKSNIQTSNIRPTDLAFNRDVIADKKSISTHLNDKDFILLDCRTPGEYAGTDVRAKKGGHIPHAKHFEWTQAVNKQDGFRLKSKAIILQDFAALGFNPSSAANQKTITTYCQAHHRSSHTYFVLRWLGFDKVKGYHGSWSDWGNADDTPIAL